MIDLYRAWIQFINCWSDPFDDPKAEAKEEELNVKKLGMAFDKCVELEMVPLDWWDRTRAEHAADSQPS